MPVVSYRKSRDEAFALEAAPDLFAVRTFSKKSLRNRSVVYDPIEVVFENCNLIEEFPEAGIEIYRVEDQSSLSVSSRKSILQQHSDVNFAGSVLVDSGSKKPVLYTENLFIKFHSDKTPSECVSILEDHDLSVKIQLSFSFNGYWVQSPVGTGQLVFEKALSLLDREDVIYCHPELVSIKGRKALSFPQWHLQPTLVDGNLISQHSHVIRAHQVTKGAGTTIAIIDDGCDIDHEEFNSAGKFMASFDAMSLSSDPRPQAIMENHGTACAGIACANGNHGALGVAPEARLMPIRLSANLGSVLEATAISWAVDNGADVISCSWGPPDGRWFDPGDPLHNAVGHMPAHTREALEYATRKGRQGRGCVITFAAGNGNESVDNDEYASNENVMAIAACNDRGKRSVYSDVGAAISCCFPSNDFEFDSDDDSLAQPAPLTSGIWTTDRSGSSFGYGHWPPVTTDLEGYYTNRFGGTSSSCPGVAGVAALVLSLNPRLTWTEVREIIESTCEKIDESNGKYDSSGHSLKYGYGRVHALRAVKMALPVERQQIQILRTFNQPIQSVSRSMASRLTQVVIEIQEQGVITRIEVGVRIRHSFIGALIVELIPPAPAGLKVMLHNREGGSATSLERNFANSLDTDLGKLIGQNIQGTWTLRVIDNSASATGVIELFGLDMLLDNSTINSATSMNRQATTKKPAKQKPAKQKPAKKKPAKKKPDKG